MTIRRAKNYAGIKNGTQSNAGKLGFQGVGGTKMFEPRPKYIKADNEHVITDTNGSYIVLGRDRPSTRVSGYGHEHGSARVDIVVGRMLADPQGPYGEVDELGKPILVDPSFEKDAARVYVSAKSDIDDYFKLRKGTVGMSRTRSAVGIKADAVRIIGREGIKLVTRPEPHNSLGGTIEYVKGIDLIAGNDDRTLQPLVKGRDLVKMLEGLIDWVGKLNGIVDGILLDQMQLNTAIATHTHIVQAGPFPGVALPSVELALVAPKVAISQTLNGAVALKTQRSNQSILKLNTLKESGKGYILSRYNNTN